MISLHAGRLLLFCDRADRTWHCRVILGPKPEHQVEADTGTLQLPEAMLRAKTIYAAARLRIRPADAPVMCWDCLQWDTLQNRCGLGLPESKRTGGRYAPRCEMYDPAHGDRPH